MIELGSKNARILTFYETIDHSACCCVSIVVSKFRQNLRWFLDHTMCSWCFLRIISETPKARLIKYAGTTIRSRYLLWLNFDNLFTVGIVKKNSPDDSMYELCEF